MATTPDQNKGMLAYAAPSLFQPHRAREAIRDAHEKKIPPLMCCYFGISSVPLARYLAPLGFDAVWIDWEHTSCNVETMTDMVHTTIFMSQGRTIPWVRVPGHDHAAIGYALDAGASIVVPQVTTVEEAQHVVSSAKFGTKQRGTRSAPPFRLIPGVTDTAFDGSGDIHKALNKQAAIMIQIEDLEGIENLDDILTQVPDIDAVWLGTLDARISMNMKVSFTDPPTPEWIAAEAKFFEVMDKHDKPYAGFAMAFGPIGSPEKFKESSRRMSLMAVSADVWQLMLMGQQLQEAKDLVAEDRADSKTNGVTVPQIEEKS